MLSPAASLELSTEAQRHQKRVKEEEEEEHHKAGEEEEEEGEDVEPKVTQEEESKSTGTKLDDGKKKQPDRVEVSTEKLEEAQDQVTRNNKRDRHEREKELTQKTSQKKEEVPTVEEGVERPSTPSYPNLHTSTSVNWCYLKYVKPNPSAQRDPRTSVYSTWSISAHNPNLPGLSTKVALSLLCSKQKHSSEIYTMATSPTQTKAKLSPASHKTSHVAEVNINTIYYVGVSLTNNHLLVLRGKLHSFYMIVSV